MVTKKTIRATVPRLGTSTIFYMNFGLKLTGILDQIFGPPHLKPNKKCSPHPFAKYWIHIRKLHRIYTGADPGFQARGPHLKKLRRAEGGAKIFGVFRVKNHDFTPKIHIFSNFFGGGGRRVHPTPGSVPDIYIYILHFSSYYRHATCSFLINNFFKIAVMKIQIMTDHLYLPTTFLSLITLTRIIQSL